MPAAFVKCAKKRGSKIRAKTLPHDRYVQLCFPPGGGPAVRGEVKKYKEAKKAERIDQTKP